MLNYPHEKSGRIRTMPSCHAFFIPSSMGTDRYHGIDSFILCGWVTYGLYHLGV